MKILYSQCWEDPITLAKGLKITEEDDIISIASGGDNTLALLLENPRSIIAVDRNQSQIYLVELKIAAIKNLNYEQFINIMGARSDVNRKNIYHSLRNNLSPGAQNFWDNHSELIEQGLIHTGKFENYFKIFRSYILPLIHQRRTINNYLSLKSVATQNKFYYKTWNNLRWQYIFRLFFSKFILSRIGRSSEFFRYVTLSDISKTLINRVENGLTKIPIRDNYFVEYILTGRYHNPDILPPYLNQNNFEILKERVDRIKLVCSSLNELMDSLPDNAVSKFNLSDTFEYMNSNDVIKLLQKLIRISRQKAKIALWTLFVPQTVPNKLNSQIAQNSTFDNLYADARTFFYNNFCIWQIIKR